MNKKGAIMNKPKLREDCIHINVCHVIGEYGTKGCVKSCPEYVSSAKESSDVLDDNAIDILKRLADEEPECESSLSDMVRMLWDDYCESHGEPDVEIG